MIREPYISPFTLYTINELHITARQRAYNDYLDMVRGYYEPHEILGYVEFKKKAIRESQYYYKDGTFFDL